MADLFRAAETGNVRALKMHLRAGKNCNTSTRSTKATPLIWGTRKKRTRVVKVLLKCQGIDTDLQDSNGNTALHYACRNKDITIASLLFGHGADLTLKNERDEYAMQLADFNFFKACVLDQHDETIRLNIENTSLADAKALIAKFEINESLQRINRLRIEIEQMNLEIKRGLEKERFMSMELPRVHKTGDNARILQDILFTRLGEVRAEHLQILQKCHRMEEIAKIKESKIELFNRKSDKYDTASEAITAEIEEIVAGLAAKTDTLTPLRLNKNNEEFQQICVTGLLSLLVADKTEAIHQGLSGENCSKLIKDIQIRFKDNMKIQQSGYKVVDELKKYKNRMYASKMIH